jgi:hypothetical protein
MNESLNLIFFQTYSAVPAAEADGIQPEIVFSIFFKKFKPKHIRDDQYL